MIARGFRVKDSGFREVPAFRFQEKNPDPWNLTPESSLGYTVIELLLALVVGSIIIAAAYTTYALIADKQQTYSSFAEVQEMGLPTLRLIERDLRMAGHENLDAELEKVAVSITQPVQVIDSGNACCDQLIIIYDAPDDVRYRMTYHTEPRNNPTRQALYLDREIWDGTAWNVDYTDALVADYVEDFQGTIAETVSGGRAKLVEVSLVLRSRGALPEARNFTKPAYNTGNYALNVTDHFYRESFTTSVNLRNVR